MNVLREGWHPKGKDGGRESWRGDYKGVNQVAGWVGKGKNPNARSDATVNHVSRPLASLKDPTAFGPPPKNVNFHGGAALPNETTPDRRGLGAPLSEAQVEAAESAVHTEPDTTQEAKLVSPPLPYRANRTGLRTDNLLPPPIYRGADNTDDGSQRESPVQVTAKSKPSLPPRLPPRSNSLNVVPDNISPPPTYSSATEVPKSKADSYLNQDAVSRLGKAGVKIPGFGIGQPQRSPNPEQAQSTATQSSPINLQGHLSRITAKQNSTSQSPSILPPPNPGQGTTLAQKQAALRTAQSFHKDPSSVSLSDAQSAAQTANNFRDRHQEQITVGAQKANTWNKKHNFTNRVNSFLEQQSTQPPPAQSPPAELSSTPDPIPQAQAPVATTPGLHVRKAPPPPPPKKPNGLHGQTTGGPGPPPVPLGTKPSFG